MITRHLSIHPFSVPLTETGAYTGDFGHKTPWMGNPEARGEHANAAHTHGRGRNLTPNLGGARQTC